MKQYFDKLYLNSEYKEISPSLTEKDIANLRVYGFNEV